MSCMRGTAEQGREILRALRGNHYSIADPIFLSYNIENRYRMFLYLQRFSIIFLIKLDRLNTLPKSFF